MNTQTMARAPVTALKPPNPHLPSVIDTPQEQIALVPLAPEPTAYPAKMAKAVLAVTKAIGGVGKHGRNTFHSYDYQKWEDVLDKMAPLLIEHNLIIEQSEVGCSTSDQDALLSITYEFALINEDGEVWPKRPRWKAIARLKDSKGVYDDKAANKCHTQAHKYFLVHFFKIKTKETVAEDSDGDVPKQQRTAQQPKPPNPNAPTNAPRTLPTGKKTTFESFAADYVKGALTSTTAAEVKEWERLNEASLDLIEERAPDIFTDLCEKVSAHAAKLVQATKPKPPNPNAPAKDPELDLVEAGRHEPGDVVWGETEEKPAEVPKLKKQLLDLIARLSTPAELDHIAKDAGFYEKKGKLSEADQQEIDLAFMRRSNDVRFPKK